MRIVVSVLAGLVFLSSLPAYAQSQSAPPLRAAAAKPAPSIAARSIPVPDENTLARLVWSTMIAVDNANRTGDYGVLYGLMSPNFQQSGSPQVLAQTFANLRQQRVDIGRTILTSPVYYIPPQILKDGSLRLRGGFEYRPKSIRFDILFELVDGGWSLSAISIAEMDFKALK